MLGKHGRHHRREALRQQVTYLTQDDRRLLMLLVGSLIGLLTTFLVLDLVVAGHRPGFATGAFVGAVTAGWLWLCWWLTMLTTGTFRLWAGGIGELWTGDTFQPLVKKGWRTISNVYLVSADVDLVLVGPGGVFAVETKWTTQRWDVSSGRRHPQLEAAVASARTSARRLGLFLGSVGFEVQAPVVPVLVLWGPGVAAVDDGHRVIGGVAVLIGAQSDLWIRDLESHDDRIDHWQVDAIADGLQAYRDEQIRRGK